MLCVTACPSAPPLQENRQRVILEEKRRKREEAKKAADAKRKAKGKEPARASLVEDEGCIIDNLLQEIRTGTTLRKTARKTIVRKPQLSEAELGKLKRIAACATTPRTPGSANKETKFFGADAAVEASAKEPSAPEPRGTGTGEGQRPAGGEGGKEAVEERPTAGLPPSAASLPPATAPSSNGEGAGAREEADRTPSPVFNVTLENKPTALVPAETGAIPGHEPAPEQAHKPAPEPVHKPVPEPIQEPILPPALEPTLEIAREPAPEPVQEPVHKRPLVGHEAAPFTPPVGQSGSDPTQGESAPGKPTAAPLTNGLHSPEPSATQTGVSSQQPHSTAKHTSPDTQAQDGPARDGLARDGPARDGLARDAGQGDGPSLKEPQGEGAARGEGPPQGEGEQNSAGLANGGEELAAGGGGELAAAGSSGGVDLKGHSCEVQSHDSLHLLPPSPPVYTLFIGGVAPHTTPPSEIVLHTPHVCMCVRACIHVCVPGHTHMVPLMLLPDWLETTSQLLLPVSSILINYSTCVHILLILVLPSCPPPAPRPRWSSTL